MTMLSYHWLEIQGVLFPFLKEEIGILGTNHERLITVIEIADVKNICGQYYHRYTGGRHCEDRTNIAIAFLAKHIFNLPTTRALIDRLQNDTVLRRLCGWERKNHIPSESTFSRAFLEFTENNMMEKLLDALVVKQHGHRLIGHISRDSTEITVREKATPKPKEVKLQTERRKRGRPKKGETVNKEPTCLEKQVNQTLAEMLADLPILCDYGAKRNRQGLTVNWKGYKLHINTIDGDIPIGAILTSASVHDSRVALPLIKMTGDKVKALYELMDSAYDAIIIREEITKRGRVPLIDFNHRGPTDVRKFEDFEQERYKNRSASERVNSNLKDNLGARNIRVRGHSKVFTHLSFGLLIMAVEQTLRLLT